MIPPALKYSAEGSTPAFTDHAEQIVERGAQVRLRIKGIRGEIGSMYAIGTIYEDYLGWVFVVIMLSLFADEHLQTIIAIALSLKRPVTRSSDVLGQKSVA
jgi:DNA-directed RNA polymerase II subunit RPB7